MNNGMDIEELNKCIKKLHLYKKQEIFLLDDIEKSIENLNFYYSSDNSAKFEELNFFISDKIRTIKKIHDDNITILYRNIEKYQNVIFKVQTSFNSIEV